MSVEYTSVQGITFIVMQMISAHTGFVFYCRKANQISLIITDHEDEDLASLNPYNQLPMLIEQNLKLFSAPIIAEYLDDRYRQNKLYADARWHEQNNVNIFGV
jgi:RNA polymerase-associated protein